MKAPATCCDWPRLLGDIAYLLGEQVHDGTPLRTPIGTPRLAEALGVARGTLRGWLDGSSVEWAQGQALIAYWCDLTGKRPEHIPITIVTLSAAKVKRARATA